MKRELLHLYGPFSIYSYGLSIAIGLLIFTLIIKQHVQFKKLKLHGLFSEILLIGIIAGIVGGRLLHIVTEELHDISSFSDIYSYWNGGFSVLGSIIAIMITVPFVLKKYSIPILPFFDLVTLHAPLLHAISRIGCFFAGCCYGLPTALPWGYIYTDPQSVAPLGICMHPTQLYSSMTLLLIFIFLFYYAQYQFTKPGQLFSIYLMCAGTERFSIDFLRADRVYWPAGTEQFLSINQQISLAIILAASIMFVWTIFQTKQVHTSS